MRTNVNISEDGVLWVMEQVHYGICEIRLGDFGHKVKLCENGITKGNPVLQVTYESVIFSKCVEDKVVAYMNRPWSALPKPPSLNIVF